MKVTDIKRKPMPLINDEEPPSKKRILFSLEYSVIAKLYASRWATLILTWWIILATVGCLWLYQALTARFYAEKVIAANAIGVRTVKAAETEKPKNYTIEQIVDAVHVLESSGGRKDGCVTRGEGVNGFGFAQHGSGEVWNCYKNYAQVRALVEQWFAEKVPAMGLSTALCYYNLGKVDGKLVNDCKYYQNFLQVIQPGLETPGHS